MTILTPHSFRSITAFALLALVVLSSPLAVPPAVFAQDPTKDDQEIYDKFQEVVKLRANGDYEAAITELRQIIAQYSKSDQVSRLAYNHLVMTYVEQGDTDGAKAAAQEGLEKYPDLVAEEITIPPKVNEYYTALRKEMFGSLTINKPKGCRVLLDGKHVGDTPLRLELVRVGEHDLTVTKAGYHDFNERITMIPGAVDKEPSLEGKKGLKWWGYRIGAGVVALSLLAVGLSGGDDTPPSEPAEPLPPPPGPPGS